MRRLLAIVNPVAGRGRTARLWPPLARGLAAEFELRELFTTRPGEALELAGRESPGYDAVLAVGGDGTVHEVINGLLRTGGTALLGVVPLGSGDDFNKLLSPRDAARRLREPSVKAVDVGRIATEQGERYFANGMDIGFGAHGARNVQRVPRFLTGFGAYLGALALTLVRYPLLRVRLQLDDGPALETETVMAAVMNGTTFGGSFRVCPEAIPDDGLLDVLVVRGIGRLSIMGLVPQVLRGTHGADQRLSLTRARRVQIESDQPLLVEADGEIAFEGARQLSVEVLPGRLRVLS